MSHHSQYPLVAAFSASVQQSDRASAASGRSGQFIAVTGPEAEQVNASAMVVIAYGLFWALAIVFVYLTFRAQQKLTSRIADLEKRLPKDV